jgi:hypothetical protein
LVAHHKLGGKRSFLMDHAYWGPQFSEEEIARSKRGGHLDHNDKGQHS